MNAQQHKARLEDIMSKIAGYPVEITIRGERAFTFSFESVDTNAGDKLAAFMKDGGANVSVETDAELEMTFVYADA